jgi:transposase
MAVADRNGLPIAIGIGSGERHETKFVFPTLWARFVGPMPEHLIGDKAYDSDALDTELRDFGVELIAPNKSNRSQTQDRRALRRYRRRWHVERLFAWLFRFRRLITRFEHKSANFLGFLRLACAVILLRRL